MQPNFDDTLLTWVEDRFACFRGLPTFGRSRPNLSAAERRGLPCFSVHLGHLAPPRLMLQWAEADLRSARAPSHLFLPRRSSRLFFSRHEARRWRVGHTPTPKDGRGGRASSALRSCSSLLSPSGLLLMRNPRSVGSSNMRVRGSAGGTSTTCVWSDPVWMRSSPAALESQPPD